MMHRVIAKCYDKRGRLLSVAENSYSKSHPEQKRLATLTGQPYKQFLHAEIAAIIRARKPVHRIMVIRVNKHGETRLAMPCVICQAAIAEAGIKIIEYTT